MGSAHSLINYHVKFGMLKPEKCYCGKTAIAHHDDYGKPDKVLWLCSSHHHKRHAFLDMRSVGLI